MTQTVTRDRIFIININTMNFNTPPENSPLEKSELNIDDAVKDLVPMLFFGKDGYPPSRSLQELSTTIKEYARGKNISEHDLDKKIMSYINKQIANSSD